jgi:hypothetical protein
VFEVFGPTLQFLVLPNSSDDAPCVLKGTIPPGVSVPIHSHGGMEAFFVLSGEIEVLSEKGGDFHWMKARPGDFIEVSSGVKHKEEKGKPRRLRSRVLGQGNADTHGGADSDRAARVQLECVSEQALQPPSQQRQSVNAMAFREESLFNFR